MVHATAELEGALRRIADPGRAAQLALLEMKVAIAMLLAPERLALHLRAC